MEVKYGLWAKKGEAQYAGALEFKRVLEAESKGKYTVAVFPGNQLGTPREMLAQLVLGTTHVMASGDPGIKEIEYLALPYLMRSIKNYSAKDSPKFFGLFLRNRTRHYCGTNRGDDSLMFHC